VPDHQFASVILLLVQRSCATPHGAPIGAVWAFARGRLAGLGCAVATAAEIPTLRRELARPMRAEY
jgi:hypothetical protein